MIKNKAFTPLEKSAFRERSSLTGFTLTEILISSTIIVFVFISIIGVFVTAQWLYAFGLAQSNLQRDVTVIAEKIIVRNPVKEQIGVYGLRSAVSFSIPVTNPVGSEIDFIGTDGNARKYFISGNSIIYQSPTGSPAERTVYTAPANTSITLLFSPVSQGGFTDNETVGVYIALAQNLSGTTISGSVSTHVNIRNIQK